MPTRRQVFGFIPADLGIALLRINDLHLAKAKERKAPLAASRRQERKGNGLPEVRHSRPIVTCQDLT